MYTIKFKYSYKHSWDMVDLDVYGKTPRWLESFVNEGDRSLTNRIVCIT